MLQQAVLGTPLEAIEDNRLYYAGGAAQNFACANVRAIPPGQPARQDIGPTPDTAKLLALKGSPVKGGILFRQAGRTLCVNCHRCRGKAKTSALTSAKLARG